MEGKICTSSLLARPRSKSTLEASRQIHGGQDNIYAAAEVGIIDSLVIADDMADNMSNSAAEENVNSSSEDLLNNLAKLQPDNKSITVEKGKLKWMKNFESLKNIRRNKLTTERTVVVTWRAFEIVQRNVGKLYYISGTIPTQLQS